MDGSEQLESEHQKLVSELNHAQGEIADLRRKLSDQQAWLAKEKEDLEDQFQNSNRSNHSACSTTLAL